MRDKITSYLMIGLILILGGCAGLRPGCIIQDKVVSVATATVASKLQCTNLGAVEASMKETVGSLGLCKAQTGPIAEVICPVMVRSVVDKVATVIPSEWGCSAHDAKAQLSGALTEACRKIPVDSQ